MRKSTNLRFSASVMISFILAFALLFPSVGTVRAKTPARIHEIQGSFFASQKIGQEVETNGVVTSLYVSTKGVEGFYVQSPKSEEDADIRTSEAIYVRLQTPIPTAKNTLKEGHKVVVSGQVAELPSVTYKGSSDSELTTTALDKAQIDSSTVGDFLSEVGVVALDKDRVIPSVISDNSIADELTPDKYSLDYFEALEAMRVSLENPQLTAPPAQDTYSTIVNETNQSIHGGIVAMPGQMFGNLVYLQVPFRFSNNANRNDKTRMKGETGDVLKGNLFGVVTYGYGTPKVFLDYNQFDSKTNTFKEDIVSIQARGNKREVADFKSEVNAPTVAQYNIENFSANPKTTTDAHVDGIASDIVNNLYLPDIINLCEVQDNDGEDNTSITDASKSIQRLVDAIEKISGVRYAWLSINPDYNADGGAPNANIRVVHLYNPKRATPLPSTSTSSEVLNADGTLVTNPSRLGVTSEAFKSTRKPLVSQFSIDGKTVTVIGNHLSSKRGDASLYGNTQPPFLGSEAGRDEQAKLINQFVQTLLSKDRDANIVVLGDFNDYEYSKPMTTLKGAELVNMIEKLAPNTRYSYNYLGRQQTLDHILVSNNLANSKVDAVHMNADFRIDNGRNSDHDAIVVQLKFPVLTGVIEIVTQDKANGTKLAGAEYDVKDAKDVIVDHVVTDITGKATTKALPLGAYTFVETKAPVGYEPNTAPVAITLATNGQVATMVTESSKIPLAPQVGVIEVIVQDKGDGKKLMGAVFEVKDAKGGVVDTLITDVTGKATSINLPLGFYTLTETIAPSGYQPDPRPLGMTITVDGQVISKLIESVKIVPPTPVETGTITITKQDKTDGTKLAGAEYDVKDAKGVVVDHIITDAKGMATTKALPLGAYTFVETKAPAGYELNTTPLAITLATNGQVVAKIVESMKVQIPPVKTGTITITKQDKTDGTKLAGAEYDVKDASGVVVDHVITDAKGMATTKALPLGAYTFVETKAPAGYELNTTPLAITLATDGQVVAKVVESMKVQTPTPVETGTITITKQDKTDGTKLAGAEYDVKDAKGVVVDHIITDAKGMATTKALPLGAYTFVETKAPAGYELNTTPLAVTLATDGQVVAKMVESMKVQTSPVPTTPTDKPTTNVDKPAVESEAKPTTVQKTPTENKGTLLPDTSGQVRVVLVLVVSMIIVMSILVVLIKRRYN